MAPEFVRGAAEGLGQRGFAECRLKMWSLFSAERQLVRSQLKPVFSIFLKVLLAHLSLLVSKMPSPL